MPHTHKVKMITKKKSRKILKAVSKRRSKK